MQETVTYRIGRLCLRSYSSTCLYDIRRCLPSRRILNLKPRASRGYASSSKVDLPSLDKKWRQIWDEQARLEKTSSGKDSPTQKRLTDELQDADTSGKKMYILPMFPYPSGNLHLGHFRNYIIPDILARFRRMQGYNVLLPMGWDAFGLPAENAAIERGIDPAVWTKDNILKMKAQLRVMNGSWDWGREFTTCDPKYYKHTQRIFLLLHEHGLAYQAESMVNYDPVDKTVLANEQVDGSGNSWRSGAKVEKRLLKQWFLRISAFKEALLEDLDLLAKDGNWPDRVLSMQRNWLGKSKGARIKFQVMDYDRPVQKTIEVFTTRPDTLFGVQYVALAANHALVTELAETDTELQAFLEKMPTLSQDSKDGFLLSKVRAINPLAFDPSTPDATKASLPIYVASYVLSDYSNGAVMGVPGHDNRDNSFWKQNRGGDPIRVVVESAASSQENLTKGAFLDTGILTSQSGKFAGKHSSEAAQEIIELLKLNDLGESAESWRLRDWLVSRQRYWGTPIPIIHCDSCGSVPVPLDQLPVELPSAQSHWLGGKTGNPLESAHEWINTPCPKCHFPAKRDTDTMDTFVDSSWYFMRFVDPYIVDAPFSPAAANELLPVDLYVGGVEHAILHLLYARFLAKFLATTPLWPAGLSPDIRGEPFRQLLTQGMVHGKTYTDPVTGRFLKPDEVSLSNPSSPIIKATGAKANVSWEKMSKSKYNGVDPSACIEQYGADATRAHMLFLAPVSEVLEWDEGKIAGVTRWLTRLHDFVIRQQGDLLPSPNVSPALAPLSYFKDRLPLAGSFSGHELAVWEKEMVLWLHVQRTIVSVTTSFSRAQNLNTVPSDLMSLTNTLLDSGDCDVRVVLPALSCLLHLLAPIAPAFAEECWSLLLSSSSGGTARTSIFRSPFPVPDGALALLKPPTQTCAVQVNGKFRFAVQVPVVPAEVLEGEEGGLERWMVRRVLESKEGGEKFCEGSEGLGREEMGDNKRMDVRRAKKVIVVRGGRTVNFVF